MKRSRIEFEKKTLNKMIHIYCKGQRHEEVLCKDCRKLLDYSIQRLDDCKFGENKTFCSKCAVHCYKPEMRMAVKKVMRYAGPRMLFYSPIMAVRHLLNR